MAACPPLTWSFPGPSSLSMISSPPPRRSPCPTAASSRSAHALRDRELDRPADTETLDLGDGCVMPGFVEAHGHPLMEAIVLSDRMVDIRPVTCRNADDVVAAIRSEVAERGRRRRLPQRLGPAAAEGPSRPDPRLAERPRPRDTAGDHPQLRAQGLLQLRGGRAKRPDARHPRPEGRQLRPRRRRRSRRHRRGDRRGVLAARRRHPAQRLSGDAARRTARGSTGAG